MKTLAQASLPVARQIWLDRLRGESVSVELGQYPRGRSTGDVAYLYLKPERFHDVIVLFHGTGNDMVFTWQRLIERLLATHHAVFTFDLDGHGQQSSTLFDSRHFFSASQDLQAALDEITGSLPRKLIGYSLGGLMALDGVTRSLLQAQSVALLAVPDSIQVSPLFAYREGLSAFHPEFWRHGLHYGMGETIPAFGSWRRKTFPIRLPPGETRSYPRIVQDLFQEAKPAELWTKLKVPRIRLFARNDVLATPLSGQDSDQRIIDRGNHFLLPFLPKTIDSLSQWIES